MKSENQKLVYAISAGIAIIVSTIGSIIAMFLYF